MSRVVGLVYSVVAVVFTDWYLSVLILLLLCFERWLLLALLVSMSILFQR